jgi:hypothetical protein
MGRHTIQQGREGTEALPAKMGAEPLWVFERPGETLELRRLQTPDGITLEILVNAGSRARSYFFPELDTLVRFQSDMEQFLLKTGWSFVRFSPDRRTGAERRTWPRFDNDRRRWWTDGHVWAAQS